MNEYSPSATDTIASGGFQNVATYMATYPSSVLVALRAIISRFALTGGHYSGTIYFPPGIYAIQPILIPGSSTSQLDTNLVPADNPDRAGNFFSPDLYVPPDIALLFAPGAMLVLSGEAVVNLAGTIKAGLYQIFDLFPLREDSPQGCVVLGGVQISEVYPEWWGAGSLPDDTQALQAAMDAAHNLRHNNFLAPGGDGCLAPYDDILPSIPIRLVGSYKISKSLELGLISGYDRLPNLHPATYPTTRACMGGRIPWPRFGNTTAFRLIGGCASVGVGRPSDDATIRAAFQFTPDTPMFVSTQVGGFTVKNVSFDGSGMTDVCVLVEGLPSNPADPAHSTGSSQSGQFVNCSFRDANKYLVHVGQRLLTGELVPGEVRVGSEEVATPVETSGTGVDSQDMPLFSLTRCQFLVTNREAVGVVLRAGNAVPMEVRNCLFSGEARAMIRGFAGVVVVTGCTFQNSFHPDVTPPIDLTTGLPFPNGADVYIDLDPPTLLGYPVGNMVVLYPGQDVAPVPQRGSTFLPYTPSGYFGLTVVNCQSRSLQFLAMFPNLSQTPLVRLSVAIQNVTLIGVHHVKVGALAAIASPPPVIDWNYPRSFTLEDGTTGGLVLLGCHFDGQLRIGNQALVGPVTDLGTTFTRSDAVQGWEGDTTHVYNIDT